MELGLHCFSGQTVPCGIEISSVLITSVLVEFLRCIALRRRKDQINSVRNGIKKRNSGYELVHSTDVSEDLEADDGTEVQVATSQSDAYSLAEVTFAAYQTFYVTFCWSSFVLATQGVCPSNQWHVFLIKVGIIDVWLAWILVLHLLCALHVAVAPMGYRVDATFIFKVPLSLAPGLSEPLNTLRNPLLAGIYVLYGPSLIGPMCATLVVVGTVLPLGAIYQRPHFLRQLRVAHWPILSDACLAVRRHADFTGWDLPEESASDGEKSETSLFAQAWISSVDFVNDGTCPCKQYLVLYEELPHIIAGITFLALSEHVFLVVCVSVTISAIKFICVFIFRPYALCWSACAGKAWDDVNELDVSRATLCHAACLWSIRSSAARSLLAPGVRSEVRIAAAEALGNLLGNMISKEDDALEDPDDICAKEVMKTRACLAQLLLAEQPLADVAKRALLKLAGPAADPAAIDVLASNIQCLSSGSAETRQQAAENLTALASYAAPCMTQLMYGSLRDADPDVREVMASSLRILGSSSSSCAVQVAIFLDHSEPDICCAALEALGSMSERGAPFASRITELLENDNECIRTPAANALANLGRHAAAAVPQLISLLDHSVPGVREASTKTLGRLTDSTLPKVVVPKLVTLLDDSCPCVRSSATEALATYGEQAIPFTRRIFLLTDDMDASVRAASAEALGKLGDDTAAHVDKLAKLLHDSDPSVRHAAAHALGEMGEAGAPFAAQLARLLTDTNLDVRCAAVQTLGQLGSSASPFACQIAKLLAEADTREAALSAFGWLGEHASPCAAKLADLLTDTNPEVRTAAVKALAELGDHATPFAPRLARLLADVDPAVRDAAASSLGGLGWHGALFAQEIANLLDDADATVCYTAAEALGNLGEHAGPYTPQIARLLSSADPEIRFAATEALGNLASYATPFISDIGRNLRDDDNCVRYAALEAIARFGERAAAFVPQVASLADDTDAGVRRGVAEALGKFGDAASPFLPQLEQLRMDEDEFVGKAATASLQVFSR